MERLRSRRYGTYYLTLIRDGSCEGIHAQLRSTVGKTIYIDSARIIYLSLADKNEIATLLSVFRHLLDHRHVPSQERWCTHTVFAGVDCC